jgi:[ribosomal protein S18]-alanine N-acetyltransferase
MGDPLIEVDIRALSGADSPKLGTFFEALAKDAETNHFFNPHPLTREYAFELCARVERISDRYFIATQNGDVVGYSMLRGWDEGYAVPSFGACVHPAIRNAGLGKRLLAHAIDQSQLQGATKLRLTVFKANQRAVNLYRRFGFAFVDKNSHELVGMLDLQRQNV